MEDFKENAFFRYLFYCLAAIAWLVLGYLFFKYVFVWFMPFIIAFLVSRFIEKPVRFFSDKLHLPRRAASAFVAIITYFLLALVIYILSSQLVAQFTGFFGYLPSAFDNISNQVLSIISFITDKLSNFSPELARTVTSAISTSISNLKGSLSIPFASVFDSLKWAATSIPTMLVSIIVTVISTYFISSDYEKIGKFINNQMPPKFQVILRRTKNHLFYSLWCWVRAQMFLMFITFAELTVGFILIRVPYAGILALIVAIVDALPILGVGTVLIPWGLISLLSGDYNFGISVLILYGVIAVVRNMIEPKIVGQSLGLHPLATLICIYIGLKLFGFLGMIIVPIVVMTLVQLVRWGYITTPAQMHLKSKTD